MRPTITRKIAHLLLLTLGAGTSSSCGLFTCENADLLMKVAQAGRRALGAQSVAFHAGAYRPMGTDPVPVDLTVRVGESFDVSGTEENVGDGAAGAHAMTVLQRSVAAGSPTTLAQLTVESLGSKQSTTKKTVIEAVTTGITVLEIVADGLNTIKECKEHNNASGVTATTSSQSVASSQRYLVVRVVPTAASLAEAAGQAGNSQRVAELRVRR